MIIYIVALVYIVIFCLAIYNLQGHVRNTRNERVWNLPVVALSLLMLFLIGINLVLVFLLFFFLDRIIYFVILPTGALQEQPFLSVIFSDLPALLFLSIYSVVVVRWAEIYHFTMSSTYESKLHPVRIPFRFCEILCVEKSGGRVPQMLSLSFSCLLLLEVFLHLFFPPSPSLSASFFFVLFPLLLSSFLYLDCVQ